MQERESYILANYKSLFLIFVVANFLIALLFISFLNLHYQTVYQAVKKIDRATRYAEAISSVFVTNVEQKEPEN